MLRLVGQFRWQEAESAVRMLPVVLPAAILLVLARRQQWVARDELAGLFWPEKPNAAALLNLRVNLHKAQRLIEALRIGVCIQSERRRVRWAPPIDLADAGCDEGEIAEGFDLPQYEAFNDWMRTWRAQRVRPCARLAEVDDVDVSPAEGSGSLSGKFYGRRVEMAQLRSSSAVAVVLIGEAGIGKTRLVAETLGTLPWLRFREGRSRTPFGAVADLLESQPGWLSDLGAYRLDVARLLPEIAPHEPLPPLDALTARVRLFEGLARIVERHAPILAVDDLHWADATTVEWLAMLAGRRRSRWVATARGEELPEFALRTLQSMELANELRRMTIQGLDRTALNALLFDRRPDLAGAQSFPGPHGWLEAL